MPRGSVQNPLKLLLGILGSTTLPFPTAKPIRYTVFVQSSRGIPSERVQNVLQSKNHHSGDTLPISTRFRLPRYMPPPHPCPAPIPSLPQPGPEAPLGGSLVLFQPAPALFLGALGSSLPPVQFSVFHCCLCLSRLSPPPCHMEPPPIPSQSPQPFDVFAAKAAVAAAGCPVNQSEPASYAVAGVQSKGAFIVGYGRPFSRKEEDVGHSWRKGNHAFPLKFPPELTIRVAIGTKESALCLFSEALSLIRLVK